MTTLFGDKTGYYIRDVLDSRTENMPIDIPIHKRKSNIKCKLYYGSLLNPEEWETTEVSINDIKSINPTSYHKIEIIYNDNSECDIRLVNRIEFC